MSTPFEPKPSLPADTPVVEEHLSDLLGLGPASLADLDTPEHRTDPGPLQVADLLRKRNDGTIALEPHVRRRVSNQYVDRLLYDALAFLKQPTASPGYFHPSHNLRGRQHGGACGLEAIKPAHHFPRALLDALADLRGDYIITNIGQSGCFSCGRAAINTLREQLEAEGTHIHGRAGFSAQSNPKNPVIRYEGFDDKYLSTRELGQSITAALDAHNVPFDWDGDPTITIQTYPDHSENIEF